MNMYNLLFGMNPHSDFLLAVVGLRKHDVQRFRDVSASSDGREIYVYSRTGGGNREDYPNTLMREIPLWVSSTDDDFDSTYCTDTIRVPDEFAKDVVNLSDILGKGIRAKFGKHLLKTLKREPTESDIRDALYEAESAKLARTQHVMANGHTFVPYDDSAMKTALELAETNGGELLSCWGILPLVINVKRDFQPWPNAKVNSSYLKRVDIGYEWNIDVSYWEHCKEVFQESFPVTISKIAEEVADYIHRRDERIR